MKKKILVVGGLVVVALLVVGFFVLTSSGARYVGIRVIGAPVDSGKDIQRGQVVQITATGTVDFGGGVLFNWGAPKLDADGDAWATPADYPAPALRKNSLIAIIGNRTYAGGTTATFTSLESGRLYLRANDRQTEDNSGGWDVTVQVHDPQAQPSNSGGRSETEPWFGPFGPLAVDKPTKTVYVRAGSAVHLTSDGQLNLGGGVVLKADGDSWPTPADYPAPSLHKNSLIAKVGSTWYQGGSDVTFTPTEDGFLILQANDGAFEDNTGAWNVSGNITQPPIPDPPPRGPTTYGPFTIVNEEKDTKIDVAAGQQIHIEATGIIDFGGAVFGIGAPKVGPDGDDWATPKDYPAPPLRKNSLIVKVGATWYQGGKNVDITPSEGGRIILRPNDNHLEDNSRSWDVHMTIR